MKRKVFHGDENRRKKRQWSRQKCGHCEQFLGHTQYHEHRRLYFNSTLNQWTTVHDLRQKKCEPEDVPGSSSSESEGKISCHSRLLEFPKKRQTLTKAWFPYDRCDRCDRSLRNKTSAIVAIAATTIAEMELFSYLCGRCRCDRWKLVSLWSLWSVRSLNLFFLSDRSDHMDLKRHKRYKTYWWRK